jgi:N12 class adenine-specific DNA methylase
VDKPHQSNSKHVLPQDQEDQNMEQSDAQQAKTLQLKTNHQKNKSKNTIKHLPNKTQQRYAALKFITPNNPIIISGFLLDLKNIKIIKPNISYRKHQ